MASKRFENGSVEWFMFQEFWGLCQKYWIPEDNDEYWQSLIDATNEFYEKHKNTDKTFSMKLALSLIDTLEAKYKERRKVNNDVDRVAVMEEKKA